MIRARWAWAIAAPVAAVSLVAAVPLYDRLVERDEGEALRALDCMSWTMNHTGCLWEPDGPAPCERRIVAVCETLFPEIVREREMNEAWMKIPAYVAKIKAEDAQWRATFCRTPWAIENKPKTCEPESPPLKEVQ
jgi:hypothetical protein